MDHLVPWNDLQTRCLEQINASNLTLPAFARGAGVHPHTFRRWLRRKGSTLRERALVALAKALGIPLDQAVQEAGGRTDEQRRAELGRQLAKKNFPPVGTGAALEILRKSGRSRRGKPRHPDGIARMMATRKATSANDRSVAALVAASRSKSGRVIHQLFGRLRWKPDPSPDQLREWATVAGTQADLPPEAVQGIWRPHLLRLGLVSQVGRRFNSKRHELVLERLVARGLTPAGPIPRSFWDDAMEAIGNLEGKRAPNSPESVRQWWIDHKPSCLACLSAAPTKIKR